MTNTQKQKLALLIHSGNNTSADLRAALAEEGDCLEIIASPYGGDNNIIFPDIPLERDQDRYPPDATFHLSEQGQDALDAALEKEALLRYEQEMRDIAHNQLLIGGMTLFISALALIASIIMFIAS